MDGSFLFFRPFIGLLIACAHLFRFLGVYCCFPEFPMESVSEVSLKFLEPRVAAAYSLLGFPTATLVPGVQPSSQSRSLGPVNCTAEQNTD